MIESNTILKYKATGLEWIPKVPVHWEVLRIKNIATINDEALSENTKPDFPIKYIDIGNVNSDGEINEIQEFIFADSPSRARRILRKGDVIISTVRTYLKAITQISFDVENHIASTGFAVLRPKDNITSDFLNYAVKAHYFIDSIMTNSFGVSYPAINSSVLATLPILVPPKDEQDEIVQYIKAQEEKINLFIQKKQRFIELLKEQRQSVILNTTRAFDRADKSIRVKYLGRIRSGDGISNENLKDEGEYGVFGGNGLIGYTNIFNAEGENIIIGRVGAKCGNIRLINDRKFISDNALILALLEKDNYEYVAMVLEALDLNKLSVSNAQPLITGTKVMNIAIPHLSADEQKQIVSHIKTETTTIDTAIAKTEREIELIREYKEAMISEAVMGKRNIN